MVTMTTKVKKKDNVVQYCQNSNSTIVFRLKKKKSAVRKGLNLEVGLIKGLVTNYREGRS